MTMRETKNGCHKWRIKRGLLTSGPGLTYCVPWFRKVRKTSCTVLCGAWAGSVCWRRRASCMWWKGWSRLASNWSVVLLHLSCLFSLLASGALMPRQLHRFVHRVQVGTLKQANDCIVHPHQGLVGKRICFFNQVAILRNTKGTVNSLYIIALFFFVWSFNVIN